MQAGIIHDHDGSVNGVPRISASNYSGSLYPTFGDVNGLPSILEGYGPNQGFPHNTLPPINTQLSFPTSSTRLRDSRSRSPQAFLEHRANGQQPELQQSWSRPFHATVEDDPGTPSGPQPMSISEDNASTPRAAPMNHQQPYNRPMMPQGLPRLGLSPLQPRTSFSSLMDPTYQHDFFCRLLRICTRAALMYYQNGSQRRLSEAIPLRQPASGTWPFNLHRRQGPPFDISSPPSLDPQFPLYRGGRGRAPSLMTLLFRICDSLWLKAKDSHSHTAELEAVHRMGNLYAWADRVISASRCPELLSEEAVYATAMAARDLTSYCLFEDGKREIDALREGSWELGGVA